MQQFKTVLAWGAFLATSWTWCIGMWLPVILLRDLGPWSFLAFAAPNVAGAAAMGLILRRPGAAERFLVSHRGACEAFSFVTIAFQMFFLIWLIVGHGGPLWERALMLAAFMTPAILLSGTSVANRRTLLVTSATLVLSFAMGAWWLLSPASAAAFVPPLSSPGNLLSVTSVCLVGFVACPFLDLTFLRARITLDGAAGNAAFVIGFFALFFPMILFTFLYAGPLLAGSAEGRVFPGMVSVPIVVHMLFQLGATVALHASTLRESAAPSVWARLGAGGAMVLAFIVFMLPIGSFSGLSGQELVYRMFLAFYGLVAPAYLATCAFGKRTQVASSSIPVVRLAMCGLTILLASPFYWLGFMERRYAWLAAGAGVIALAAVASRVVPGARRQVK